MEKESNNQIILSEFTKNNDIHYFKNKNSLQKLIRRLAMVLMMVSSFLFSLYCGDEVIKIVRSLCLRLGINLSLYSDIINNIIAVLLTVTGFVVFDVIYTLVHKMIHIVIYGKKEKNGKTFFKKGTLWGSGNCCVTKSQRMVITIVSFAFFEVLAGVVGIMTNSMFVFLFITVVSFLSSLIDVFILYL